MATRVTTKADAYVTVCFMDTQSIIFELGERQIKINGMNENLRGADTGILAVGKFGRSVIKKEDWDEIVRRYGSMTMFKKGFIFAEEETAVADAKAKERKDMRTGQEPVDTKKTRTKADK